MQCKCTVCSCGYSLPRCVADQGGATCRAAHVTQQMQVGPASWTEIQQQKRSVKIPIKVFEQHTINTAHVHTHARDSHTTRAGTQHASAARRMLSLTLALSCHVRQVHTEGGGYSSDGSTAA